MPHKKLRINVKMTKKFLIHLLFHMFNLTLTKCIRILLVYTSIHYGLSKKLWLDINNKFKKLVRENLFGVIPEFRNIPCLYASVIK